MKINRIVCERFAIGWIIRSFFFFCFLLLLCNYNLSFCVTKLCVCVCELCDIVMTTMWSSPQHRGIKKRRKKPREREKTPLHDTMARILLRHTSNSNESLWINWSLLVLLLLLLQCAFLQTNVIKNKWQNKRQTVNDASSSKGMKIERQMSGLEQKTNVTNSHVKIKHTHILYYYRVYKWHGMAWLDLVCYILNTDE